MQSFKTMLRNLKMTKKVISVYIFLIAVLLLSILNSAFRRELQHQSEMKAYSLMQFANNDFNFTSDEIFQSHTKAGPEMVISNLKNIELPWWEDVQLLQCSQHYHPTTLTEAYPIADKDWVITNQSSLKKEFNEHRIKVPVSNHCGYSSALRGYNQSVISYSVYGESFQYFRGFPEILYDAENLYPGWIVRIYLNPRGKQAFLCPLLLKYRKILDICDVHNLPKPLGDIASANVDPRIWRMSPFGDPMVLRSNVRDADSKLTAREQAAVSEWVESKALIHIMRDHPWHGAIMLAGMFGIYQPEEALQTFEKIRIDMFKRRDRNDQSNLATSFTTLYTTPKCLQHDSYLCKRYKGNIKAFPTQRQEDGDYVGRPIFKERAPPKKINMKPCPVACRPKNHQDWTYC